MTIIIYMSLCMHADGLIYFLENTFNLKETYLELDYITLNQFMYYINTMTTLHISRPRCVTTILCCADMCEPHTETRTI